MRYVVVVAAMLAACGGDPGGGRGAGGAAAELDGRLVGKWRFTDSNPQMATDLYCQMRADGSYVYSGQSVSNFLPTPENTMPSVTGKWRTKDGRLLALPDGQTQWLDIGAYSVSGDGLLIYSPTGAKAYWERTG